MKLFKKKFYISSQELSTILIFSLVIFILSFYRPIHLIEIYLNYSINDGLQLSNFDFLRSFGDYDGLIDYKNYILIIIPLFSVLIIYLIDTNNVLLKTIRYKNRNEVWNKNIFLIIISAFLLSILLVIGGYLISGVFLKGYNNTWNSELGLPYKLYGTTEIWSSLSSFLVTYKILLVFWTTTFLGLCFIGIFICTFKLFIPNTCVFFITIVMTIGDAIQGLKFNFIMGIEITSSNWVHTISIIANNIYFLVCFFVLYFWGRYIYSQKDQGIVKKS